MDPERLQPSHPRLSESSQQQQQHNPRHLQHYPSTNSISSTTYTQSGSSLPSSSATGPQTPDDLLSPLAIKQQQHLASYQARLLNQSQTSHLTPSFLSTSPTSSALPLDGPTSDSSNLTYLDVPLPPRSFESLTTEEWSKIANVAGKLLSLILEGKSEDTICSRIISLLGHVVPDNDELTGQLEKPRVVMCKLGLADTKPLEGGISYQDTVMNKILAEMARSSRKTSLGRGGKSGFREPDITILVSNCDPCIARHPLLRNQDPKQREEGDASGSREIGSRDEDVQNSSGLSASPQTSLKRKRDERERPKVQGIFEHAWILRLLECEVKLRNALMALCQLLGYLEDGRELNGGYWGLLFVKQAYSRIVCIDDGPETPVYMTDTRRSKLWNITLNLHEIESSFDISYLANSIEKELEETPEDSKAPVARPTYDGDQSQQHHGSHSQSIYPDAVPSTGYTKASWNDTVDAVCTARLIKYIADIGQLSGLFGLEDTPSYKDTRQRLRSVAMDLGQLGQHTTSLRLPGGQLTRATNDNQSGDQVSHPISEMERSDSAQTLQSRQYVVAHARPELKTQYDSLFPDKPLRRDNVRAKKQSLIKPVTPTPTVVGDPSSSAVDTGGSLPQNPIETRPAHNVLTDSERESLGLGAETNIPARPQTSDVTSPSIATGPLMANGPSQDRSHRTAFAQSSHHIDSSSYPLSQQSQPELTGVDSVVSSLLPDQSLASLPPHPPESPEGADSRVTFSTRALTDCKTEARMGLYEKKRDESSEDDDISPKNRTRDVHAGGKVEGGRANVPETLQPGSDGPKSYQSPDAVEGCSTPPVMPQYTGKSRQRSIVQWRESRPRRSYISNADFQLTIAAGNSQLDLGLGGLPDPGPDDHTSDVQSNPSGILADVERNSSDQDYPSSDISGDSSEVADSSEEEFSEILGRHKFLFDTQWQALLKRHIRIFFVSPDDFDERLTAAIAASTSPVKMGSTVLGAQEVTGRGSGQQSSESHLGPDHIALWPDISDGDSSFDSGPSDDKRRLKRYRDTTIDDEGIFSVDLGS